MHRRGSAPHYTVANLIQYQPEMQQHTLELTSVNFYHAFCICRNLIIHSQYLSAIAGKTSTDCLPVFRHLLLDVMSTTSYNYDLGALSEYSAEFEHPLAGAVNDFPKWGILVSYVNCTGVTRLTSHRRMRFLFGPGTWPGKFLTRAGERSTILTKS